MTARPSGRPNVRILMLMANDGIHATSPAARAAASPRFAALAIQAFQVHDSGAGLPHWGPDVQVGTVGGGPAGQPAFPVGDR